MRVRPIRIDGDIAYVPLTRGYESVIDAADVHLVDSWNWYARVKQHTNYAVRNNYQEGTRRNAYIHRVVMAAPDDMHVDHINGNGLDNRRSNLRIATMSQNLRNQRLSKLNTSGFKGVCFDKGTGRWLAQIVLHGKNHFLGRFVTPELANAAREAASEKLHGEFRRSA